MIQPTQRPDLPPMPLGDEVKPHIPVLAPKYTRPIRLPEAVDAWQRLQRIGAIELQPMIGEDVQTMYAIRLRLRRRRSRLPTAAYNLAPVKISVTGDSFTLADLDTTPAFQDYRNLRD